ncbi:MAG TPA: T9SS type A sorting domain-containing protein [Ignavibacteriaceae bacterium]|nr:T9SS type A sorting domain-containing protein [Ignavibacteriaceae bacterium]
MKKIIFLFFIVFIFNNLSAQDSSKIIVPLEIGNKWQYMYEYYNGGYSSEYSLFERSIYRDTIINGKRYYFFWKSQPTRYDYNSNKLLIYFNGEEKQIMDFNTPEDSSFDYFNVATGYYQSQQVFKEIKKVISDSMQTTSIHVFYSLDSEGYWFANKYGLSSYFDLWRGPGGRGSSSSYELLRAIIYDSTGNYTYYTDTNRCNIKNYSYEQLYNSNAKFKANIDHGLNSTYRWFNFVDNCLVEYFYQKGEIKTDTLEFFLNKIDYFIFENYLALNTNLLNQGYKLYYRIVAKDKSLIPVYTYTEFTLANYNPTLDANDINEFKINYSLEQNYPNPFNPVSTIKYAIEKPFNVVIKIFDVLGNEITKLIDEPKERGYYSVDFDASKLASGIYYYSLQAGDFHSVKKMVLLK